MMTRLIDGKAMAANLRAGAAQAVSALDFKPGLAVVLVGEDPASSVYVRNKGKATIEAGLNSFEHKLSEDISEGELLSLIDKLNKDDFVDGILV
jgi:methylenetetrahydrofolate dehydrogenase (NADP+)/methenyltetrahydrofolate cyclohydrolase